MISVVITVGNEHYNVLSIPNNDSEDFSVKTMQVHNYHFPEIFLLPLLAECK